MLKLNLSDLSVREQKLVGACLLLGGIVIGMLVSPRKNVMIGSRNGNENPTMNYNYGNEPKAEEDSYEGDVLPWEE